MGVRPLSAPWSPWLQARRSLLIFRSVGIAALPYQSIIPPHILQSFSWPARWQIPRHSPPIRDGGTNETDSNLDCNRHLVRGARRGTAATKTRRGRRARHRAIGPPHACTRKCPRVASAAVLDPRTVDARSGAAVMPYNRGEPVLRRTVWSTSPQCRRASWVL